MDSDTGRNPTIEPSNRPIITRDQLAAALRTSLELDELLHAVSQTLEEASHAWSPEAVPVPGTPREGLQPNPGAGLPQRQGRGLEAAAQDVARGYQWDPAVVAQVSQFASPLWSSPSAAYFRRLDKLPGEDRRIVHRLIDWLIATGAEDLRRELRYRLDALLGDLEESTTLSEEAQKLVIRTRIALKT